MTPPETLAREQLRDMLAAEYAAEQFPVRDDKLHGSLGANGTVLGVYPERTPSSTRDRLVNEMEIIVQFYGKYDLKVDPTQTVSPSWIEAHAERFRNALRTITDTGTGQVWYYTLERIEYPDDPTGNKTRFEAYIRARGNNTALVETVA